MDLVGLVYQPHTPATVELSEGSILYVVVQNDIALLWVTPDLVPTAMSKRCGCCGNERNCFRLATEQEINQWRGQ